MKSSAASAITIVLGILGSRAALAQEPPEAAGSEPTQNTGAMRPVRVKAPDAPRPSIVGGGVISGRRVNGKRWYGSQIAAVLLPSDAITAALVATGQEEAIAFGVVACAPVQAFTGTIVHWVHGNILKGFLALPLNVGLPIASAIGGAATRSQPGFFALTAVGVIGAQAIDIFGLAYETVKVPVQSSKSDGPLRPTSFAVVPMIDKNRRGLAIVGQF